jgi:hypothetical protein
VTVDPVTLVAILLVGALVAVTVALWLRGRRTARLKARFGPEYARIVQLVGAERKAAGRLHPRERRVDGYPLKPLPPELRQHFIAGWMRVQAQFVDDPRRAVTRADDLLGEVVAARGYPLSDFAQQAEDLSVDHAELVENYRAAHDIALRHARGEASTEELRMAMIHYRTLFDDLVHEPELHRERPITIEPAGTRR